MSTGQRYKLQWGGSRQHVCLLFSTPWMRAGVLEAGPRSAPAQDRLHHHLRRTLGNWAGGGPGCSLPGREHNTCSARKQQRHD